MTSPSPPSHLAGPQTDSSFFVPNCPEVSKGAFSRAVCQSCHSLAAHTSTLITGTHETGKRKPKTENAAAQPLDLFSVNLITFFKLPRRLSANKDYICLTGSYSSMNNVLKKFILGHRFKSSTSGFRFKVVGFFHCLIHKSNL